MTSVVRGRVNTGAAASPSGIRGSILLAVVHGVAPLTLMAIPIFNGHAAIAVLVSVLGLAALSIGYSPLARTRRWAKEHIFDLWVMVVVMLLPLWGFAAAPHHSSGRSDSSSARDAASGSAGSAFGAESLVAVGVVVAWAVVRVVCACRSGSRADAAGSAASGIACACGLLWMLAA